MAQASSSWNRRWTACPRTVWLFPSPQWQLAGWASAGLRIVAMSPHVGSHLKTHQSIFVASRECHVTFPSPSLQR